MRFFSKLKKKQPRSYEGFAYDAGELSAYLYSGFSFFILSLRNGDIIRHYPGDVAAFAQWLEDNQVRNVKDETGG